MNPMRERLCLKCQQPILEPEAVTELPRRWPRRVAEVVALVVSVTAWSALMWTWRVKEEDVAMMSLYVVIWLCAAVVGAMFARERWGARYRGPRNATWMLLTCVVLAVLWPVLATAFVLLSSYTVLAHNTWPWGERRAK